MAISFDKLQTFYIFFACQLKSYINKQTFGELLEILDRILKHLLYLINNKPLQHIRDIQINGVFFLCLWIKLLEAECLCYWWCIFFWINNIQTACPLSSPFHQTINTSPDAAAADIICEKSVTWLSILWSVWRTDDSTRRPKAHTTWRMKPKPRDTNSADLDCTLCRTVGNLVTVDSGLMWIPSGSAKR